MAPSTLTNTRTPSPANPSSLEPRYEIRRLGPEHVEWASAIVTHSNLFHSPLWPKIYPKDITANLHRSLRAADYLVRHQIDSGMSFGVFDTEFTFKRPESAATDGKLYWDEKEEGVLDTEGLEAESKRLTDQMDFPLVSVALSYDAADPLDFAKMSDIMECLPHFGTVYHILGEGDKRDPNPSVPTAHGQVLYRNATATRRDYEGEGAMSGLARWLMREADAKGFRGIQIETISDSVAHVWSHPPEPYKGQVVFKFNTRTWEDEEGNKPFLPAEVDVCKIFVDLKPQA